MARTEPFFEWTQTRRSAGYWPYSRWLDRGPTPAADVADCDGRLTSGLNFASVDYLGLATHPAVRDAASRAALHHGVHSASSAALQGETRASLELASEIAELLRTEHALLFPTGWAAGFGSIAGLVRHYDYVVMDKLAHACLQQGAAAATQNLRRHAHLDIDAVAHQLAEIRQSDARAGILVVTEGLFSMDSDSPRLAELQATCREFEATLLVDVAHDLGASGPAGTGQLGVQGMLGQVDLVMGAFSKTFAANGGFLTANSEAALQFVRAYAGPWTFSTALSPIQLGVIRESLRIVRSQEGDQLRASLGRNVATLRHALSSHGLRCIGEPSAIVPVILGNEHVARVTSRMLHERGVHANLVEFPAVAIGTSRVRLQVMATHTEQQAREVARLLAAAIADATEATEATAGVG